MTSIMHVVSTPLERATPERGSEVDDAQEHAYEEDLDSTDPADHRSPRGSSESKWR